MIEGRGLRFSFTEPVEIYSLQNMWLDLDSRLGWNEDFL